MSVVVTYPDGSTETIVEAVRVDTQNFHEGMFDFYDERGNLLRQIDMGSGISWVETGAGLDPSANVAPDRQGTVIQPQLLDPEGNRG